MKDTINVDDSMLDVKKTSLFSDYTLSLLQNLKEGEIIHLESGDGKKFSFYRENEFSFGVGFNSLGLKFDDNPMNKENILKLLEQHICVDEQLREKISDDLVFRLRDIFFEKNQKNAKDWDSFDIDTLFKNLTVEDIIGRKIYYEYFLKFGKIQINNGMLEYLCVCVHDLEEQLNRYPKDSVLYTKIYGKLEYLKNYKILFSDKNFLDQIDRNKSDIEDLLIILRDSTIDSNKISDVDINIRAKGIGNIQSLVETRFNQIYLWDAFAIPYSQFRDKYGYTSSMDQGTRALGELNGWTHGSDEINRLGKKQEKLMDNNVTFKQKENFFQDANQEYISSIGFLLGTGSNKLTSKKDYYEGMKNRIDLNTFIVTPCSDIYPAVLQKSILPLYLNDLYQELCVLLGKKDLDKTIHQYILELKTPSGIAKLKSAFSNNETKINCLEKISEKILLLKKKFSDLDKQIQLFGIKKNEDLQKIASEFCVIEDFFNVNNVNIYPPFIMADQEKLLKFMKNN